MPLLVLNPLRWGVGTSFPRSPILNLYRRLGALGALFALRLMGETEGRE